MNVVYIDIDCAMSKILSAAQEHDRVHISSVKNRLPDLRNDALEAILYVLTTFLYRGRREELSERYEKCLKKALDEMRKQIDVSSSVNDQQIEYLLSRYESIAYSQFEYRVNYRDKEMVRTFFQNIHPKLREFEYNPVRYIEEMIKRKKFGKLITF